MQKQIGFIQCCCGHGRLERFAATGIENSNGDGIEKQSVFYSCDSCDKIYKEAISSFGSLGIEPYTGDLTRKEIAENAPKYSGDIYEENEIIARCKHS